ncbi:type II restriction enzyme [Dyadobacter sp. BE34]|uniref:Type II restriction enzyme n=1 Tax=Dyadobacter fermentans TaxID=94254 RepID=A0ABU1R298_9BACT|nr:MULTISPECIES: BsuBI/PstI family type II restriction endonuclease [Dyadobacter]MDR6807524.1 type II restriction enzyme [Dyadobacter fermentans]MDR7045265.1 type II restriction enzyme [Dyadobacter sp. BE242]MDR7199578.1 type II restriction enzyme [Dyadobacter sp. BE34]MDR7217963.1 type II restriction enzyme [Dyadobacter sp. BE31]MDR7265469.1 type II restriction enzyme [Dyadobacter sp. BE32]
MRQLTKSRKSKPVVDIINQAIEILAAVGIPFDDKTERAVEKSAMAFLAVAGITSSPQQAQGFVEKRYLKTRDIIRYVNTHFEENISSGSYDDVRRKDLRLLVLAGLVINSAEKANAATNDPTRAYAISPSFTELIRTFGTANWATALQQFLTGKPTMQELLARKRNLEVVPVTLSEGKKLNLSAGSHNLLQKLIIEELLPRYGFGAKVLYVGDTAKKLLHVDDKTLKSLNFFELNHDELPDVIAYSQERNWLYLIEAVHSSGPINETRRLELLALTEKCTAEIIYITSFLNRPEFKKWASEIAWETEVWIADNPDHLIHFNGDKFLGPYSS